MVREEGGTEGVGCRRDTGEDGNGEWTVLVHRSVEGSRPRHRTRHNRRDTTLTSVEAREGEPPRRPTQSHQVEACKQGKGKSVTTPSVSGTHQPDLPSPVESPDQGGVPPALCRVCPDPCVLHDGGLSSRDPTQTPCLPVVLGAGRSGIERHTDRDTRVTRSTTSPTCIAQTSSCGGTRRGSRRHTCGRWSSRRRGTRSCSRSGSSSTSSTGWTGTPSTTCRSRRTSCSGTDPGRPVCPCRVGTSPRNGRSRPHPSTLGPSDWNRPWTDQVHTSGPLPQV